MALKYIDRKTMHASNCYVDCIFIQTFSSFKSLHTNTMHEKLNKK